MDQMNLRLIILIATMAVVEVGQAQTLPSEVPNRQLTPGVIAEDGHDPSVVCGYVDRLSYSKRHRQTPQGLKVLVMKRYKQIPDQAGDGEVDHDVPISLGGEDSVYNLWWQPGYAHGVKFTYHEKDDLETWAWYRVCRYHTMSLTDGQAIFQGDWRVAYCKYIDGSACEDHQGD